MQVVEVLAAGDDATVLDLGHDAGIDVESLAIPLGTVVVHGPHPAIVAGEGLAQGGKAEARRLRYSAERLFISPRTADHHVQHVHAKTGVSTRAAALWAMQNGLVREPSAGTDRRWQDHPPLPSGHGDTLAASAGWAA